MGNVLLALMVIAIIVVVAFAIYGGSDELEAALKRYQKALDALKKKPYDPDLKQAALYYGREYVRLNTNSKLEARFDEVKLMNDLNAATAAATHAVHSVSTSAASLSPANRLQRLDDLKAQGLISDDEYATRRNKILDDL